MCLLASHSLNIHLLLLLLVGKIIIQEGAKLIFINLKLSDKYDPIFKDIRNLEKNKVIGMILLLNLLLFFPEFNQSFLCDFHLTIK